MRSRTRRGHYLLMEGETGGAGATNDPSHKDPSCGTHNVRLPGARPRAKQPRGLLMKQASRELLTSPIRTYHAMSYMNFAMNAQVRLAGYSLG